MPPRKPQIEAIQLCGDGLQAMTAERLEMLRQMVAGLGLSTVVIYRDRSGDTRVDYPEHVPEGARFGDFSAFCDQQGFSVTQTHNGWRALVTTQGEDDFIGR